MKEFRVRLSERIKRTATIESFRFSPSEKIDFLPGQFLQVIFAENNKADKGLNKYLSFSCSPAKGYIEVTKRLSESQFSQRLKELKIGDEVLIKAPLGSCTFRDKDEKIAFLIGGIGITPVISIIEYINDKKLETDVVLFYSNRAEADIAFKGELDRWQLANKKMEPARAISLKGSQGRNTKAAFIPALKGGVFRRRSIKLFYFVTDYQPEDKTCIFGRISKDLLLEGAPDLKERIIFIFGPPKMVEAMQGLCLGAGCVKENTKVENFIGY